MIAQTQELTYQAKGQIEIMLFLNKQQQLITKEMLRLNNKVLEDKEVVEVVEGEKENQVV
jgi:hypothetical protein